jgi:hypothetical protein
VGEKARRDVPMVRLGEVMVSFRCVFSAGYRSCLLGRGKK